MIMMYTNSNNTMANTHIVITTIYKFSYSNYSDILHSYNHSKISKTY